MVVEFFIPAWHQICSERKQWTGENLSAMSLGLQCQRDLSEQLLEFKLFGAFEVIINPCDLILDSNK